LTVFSGLKRIEDAAETETGIQRGIYHVKNRGDRLEPVFLSDNDRELFLDSLGGCLKKGK
jgi:hypothetical protein